MDTFRPHPDNPFATEEEWEDACPADVPMHPKAALQLLEQLLERELLVRRYGRNRTSPNAQTLIIPPSPPRRLRRRS